MEKKEFVDAQAEMCVELNRQFLSLIDALQTICAESQKRVDEYREHLPQNVIPEKLIDDFLQQRRQVISELIVRVEKSASLFAVIDYVEIALNEIEECVSRMEAQCSVVQTTCQDRRPKKGFSLFNKKELSGTDVAPPVWEHPDYMFNVDAMLTRLNQIKEVSEAGMLNNIEKEKKQL